MEASRPDVLIAAHDAAEYLPFLDELLGAVPRVRTATTVPELLQAYEGQAIVLGEPDLLAAALPDMPSIRWVQSSWAGVTPLLEFGPRGFVITGVKNTFGPQMSEYVLAYLLAREVKVLERKDRQSVKEWWDQPSGQLQGKLLGLMGTGSIGSDIARKAKVFGMDVVGYSRSGRKVEPFEQVYDGSQLSEFLSRPDYVVAVLPDTAATRHLLGREAFEVMKPDCYLVNVGRGNLIDEAALAWALAGGQLAGAALDVFESEPLGPDSPLWDAPNLLLTAHIAASSKPEDIAGIFCENYRRYCNGQPLKYQVDFERGY